MDLGFALVFDPCNTCSKKDMCSMCELTFRRNGAVANNATTTGKWISVEERLPDTAEQVLVYGMRGSIRVCRYEGRCDKHFKYIKTAFYRNDNKKAMNVRYWMPLPEPPKKGGGE